MSLAENDLSTNVVESNRKASGCNDVDRPNIDAEFAAELNRLKSELNTRIDALASDNNQLHEQSKQLEAKLEVYSSVEQIEELTKKRQHAEAESQKQVEELKDIVACLSEELDVANEKLREYVEVRSELATLQCRYDELVLETKSLRSKLRHATAPSGGMLLAVEPTNFSSVR